MSSARKWMQDIPAELRWTYYYWVAEQYDRSLPHRMKDGEAVVHMEHVGDSNRNALRWTKRLALRRPDDRRHIIQMQSFEEWRRILDRAWEDGWENLPVRDDAVGGSLA